MLEKVYPAFHPSKALEDLDVVLANKKIPVMAIPQLTGIDSKRRRESTRRACESSFSTKVWELNGPTSSKRSWDRYHTQYGLLSNVLISP